MTTPAILTALVWFERHQPVALFDRTAPSVITRKRMQTMGLIGPVAIAKPYRRRDFAFVKYAMTPRGRELLNAYKLDLADKERT